MLIGIDLGTTNSLASYFTNDGPKLIPNALGQFLTPSVVSLDADTGILVGIAARHRLSTHADGTVARFKRRMGTNHVAKLGKRDFRPEDLSALVLKALKQDAEIHLKQAVDEAVISVPAYFNDIQRRATISAAEIAGLSVKRLINEPTAAALAYGLHNKDDENTFLVVDLGGGTFDVTILEMFDGVMEVRASAGDAFLGGEDFTDCILEEFVAQLGLNLGEIDEQSKGRLLALAESAKRQLSETPTTKNVFVKNESEHPLFLSRTRMEEITERLVKRMRLPVQRAISDASLKPDEIDRIVLVGGATRMPVVRQLMTKLFKRFPEHRLDPDQTIAMGAAVQAGLLMRHKALEEIVMTDVCPFTLGYETSRIISDPKNIETGLFSPLIERNTPVPVSRSQEIAPINLGQAQIRVSIYQGEAPYVKDNIKIGGYSVPIPHNAKEHERVDLRFTYDTSGVLEVIATIKSTGKQSRLIVERKPGELSGNEIEARFRALERIKIHPREELANATLIAHLTELYANHLGSNRQAVSDWLVEFEQVLRTNEKRETERTRRAIEERLKTFGDSFEFE